MGFELQWPLRYHNLILDLGDVLCFYAHTKASIPIPIFEMKTLLSSAVWHQYERGELTTELCIEKLEKDFAIKPGHIVRSIDLLKESLEWNENLVDLVRKMKAQSNGKLRVFLMTNISGPDFEFLRFTIEGWNLFDGIFPSFRVGTRKPNSVFYQHVLQEGKIDPTDTVFVDDKHENVTAAQMVGMKGILFNSTGQILQDLSRIFANGVSRAESWLEANSKSMFGLTNTNVNIRDQFSQLVILYLTKNLNLVCLSDSTRTWNVFLDKPVLTSAQFPDDLDTSAMALTALELPVWIKNEAMDEMLGFKNPERLFYTYYDRSRLRDDPFVNANIVRSFFFNDRGHEVANVVEWLTQYMATGAYKHGTRYYHKCDWVLWVLADLCAECADAPELQQMTQILREQLSDRMGCTQDAFSAALRFIAARSLGLENPRDLEIVLREQDLDGSWKNDPWIYNFGQSKILFGHVGMVTAMAWKALKDAGEDRIRNVLRRL